MKIILILLALFACLRFVCSNRLKTVFYQLPSPKIQQPVRLALLTDLHSCLYGSKQQKLLHAIQKQQPALILFAGDIYDDKYPGINTELLLQGLRNYTCIYASGNHEYRSQQPLPAEIFQLLRTYGLNILQGKCATVSANGQLLNICGVDDPSVRLYSYYDDSTEQQLAAIGQADANGCFTILLAHRPERIKQYMWYGFDLVLCGHAHGGQWRIPGLMNGLFAPNQGLFPPYAGGRYQFERGQMIVSRGLAKNHPFVPRIFNRPELVIIDLMPQINQPLLNGMAG